MSHWIIPRTDRALELVASLKGLPVIYKVGFELFLSGGPDFVRELVHRKCRVFLDLKFHDIPNTVARAASQAAMLGVEMFTLHLAGGSAMVRAVAEELADIPDAPAEDSRVSPFSRLSMTFAGRR